MSFLTEAEPPRGVPLDVAPGIRRVVAANPGKMTYWGTNTYLIDTPDGVLILDPGPNDASHLDAVLRAAQAPVVGILQSHTHSDHMGNTAAVKAATGAVTYGWHHPAATGFVADVPLRDLDRIGGWQALHTPGHASDHLCFAGPGGVLFSADHVMGWSSSIVPPPDGSMADYFSSLKRLLARAEDLYLPGHGPGVHSPHAFVRALLDHRQQREAQILHALGPLPQTTWSLMNTLYSQVDETLRRAAELNVIAHLQKLAGEGRARRLDDGWALA